MNEGQHDHKIVFAIAACIFAFAFGGACCIWAESKQPLVVINNETHVPNESVTNHTDYHMPFESQMNDVVNTFPDGFFEEFKALVKEYKQMEGKQ